jgi:hypothetical protein
MLMRAEYKKFQDLSIPKVKQELLCGERHTIIEACNDDGYTPGIID